eukprot:GGOE01002410.1.p1 GENE.GGOE01002410.1~~GGOE01002410.1.p1  ORF type:complete len:773 (-),score=217.53 GGOE01002410.1:610-2874(-)
MTASEEEEEELFIVPGYTFGCDPGTGYLNWDEYDGEDMEAEEETESQNELISNAACTLDVEEANRLSMSSARRKTISAEVYDPSEEAAFHPRIFAKSEEDCAALTKILESHFLFKHLDDRELAKVVLLMRPETYYPGQALGEDEDCNLDADASSLFYVILVGTCEVQVDGVATGMLGAGSTFGETEMMYPTGPAEACVALSAVHLYCLDRRTYQWALRATFANKRALYLRFLCNVRFLEGLSQAAMVQLADCLVSRKYHVGDFLIRCDTPPQWMYIVMEGVVRVVGRDSEGRCIDVCEFLEGAIVGELEFLHNHNSVADVIVVSAEARVARLERLHFELCIGPLKALLRSSRQADPNYTYYHRRRAEMQKMEAVKSDPEADTYLEECFSQNGSAANWKEAELNVLLCRVAEEMRRLLEVREQRQRLEIEVEVTVAQQQRALEAEASRLAADRQALAFREAARAEAEMRVRRLSASLKACQAAQTAHLEAEESRLAAERDALHARGEALAQREAAMAQREAQWCRTTHGDPQVGTAVAQQVATEKARLTEVHDERRRLAGELLQMQRQALELSRWLAQEEARCEAVLRAGHHATLSPQPGTPPYVCCPQSPTPQHIDGVAAPSPHGRVEAQGPHWPMDPWHSQKATPRMDAAAANAQRSPLAGASSPLLHPNSLCGVLMAQQWGSPVSPYPPSAQHTPITTRQSPYPARWSYCTAPANALPHVCRSPSCQLCGALNKRRPPVERSATSSPTSIGD